MVLKIFIKSIAKAKPHVKRLTNSGKNAWLRGSAALIITTTKNKESIAHGTLLLGSFELDHTVPRSSELQNEQDTFSWKVHIRIMSWKRE